MRWPKLLLVAALVINLVGCVSSDMPYTTREHWDQRIGVLTFNQAVSYYGLPFSDELLADGSHSARWRLRNIDDSDQMQPYVSLDNMILTFDRRGLLENWQTYR